MIPINYPAKYDTKIALRFWGKVTHADDGSDCWIWMAGGKHAGYGGFGINNKMNSAHRVAWELFYGEIPIGMMVCHKCDTPRCVNPNHLFLGTSKDNGIDMASKGRGAHSVLTPEQVSEIKYALKHNSYDFSQSEIARKYGISKYIISRIALGKTWKGIE